MRIKQDLQRPLIKKEYDKVALKIDNLNELDLPDLEFSQWIKTVSSATFSEKIMGKLMWQFCSKIEIAKAFQQDYYTDLESKICKLDLLKSPLLSFDEWLSQVRDTSNETFLRSKESKLREHFKDHIVKAKQACMTAYSQLIPDSEPMLSKGVVEQTSIHECVKVCQATCLDKFRAYYDTYFRKVTLSLWKNEVPKQTFSSLDIPQDFLHAINDTYSQIRSQYWVQFLEGQSQVTPRFQDVCIDLQDIHPKYHDEVEGIRKEAVLSLTSQYKQAQVIDLCPPSDLSMTGFQLSHYSSLNNDLNSLTAWRKQEAAIVSCTEIGEFKTMIQELRGRLDSVSEARRKAAEKLVTCYEREFSLLENCQNALETHGVSEASKELFKEFISKKLTYRLAKSTLFCEELIQSIRKEKDKSVSALEQTLSSFHHEADRTAKVECDTKLAIVAHVLGAGEVKHALERSAALLEFYNTCDNHVAALYKKINGLDSIDMEKIKEMIYSPQLRNRLN